MIDLQFEKYQEVELKKLVLTDSYSVGHWLHHRISFSTEEVQGELNDPEALLITDQATNTVIQVVLLEEGCDSANFQFTEKEKEQLTAWWLEQQL